MFSSLSELHLNSFFRAEARHTQFKKISRFCEVKSFYDHGNSNSSHVKIFLPKKLLECLPKCSSLPKERHRWNTNEFTWLGSLVLQNWSKSVCIAGSAFTSKL
ncbi:hypothetical protein FD755_011876 [Muntiacus reevesi]|uniref:Calmodulin binding transcription activator 1 n=1 Tax=Muntiacus reevesi TaxID=9886 RepID=A0A5N3XUC5_MUNRE|nr:hypothetical protein FD755_011876 [Muntiacus reevesi]